MFLNFLGNQTTQKQKNIADQIINFCYFDDYKTYQ